MKKESTNRKAFALLKKLANPEGRYNTVKTGAQYMLAKCYEHGYGITKSYPQACKWYDIAYISANNDITHSISDKDREKLEEYIDELDNKKTAPEEINCMIEIAENGDVDAQKWLVKLYKWGDEGVEVNYREAAYWAEKAAENGEEKSMYDIGLMYYDGKGVPRNTKKAVYWLEKATAKGNGSAAVLLGKYYKSQRKFKEAVKWFKKGTELNIVRRNNIISRNKGGDNPLFEIFGDF